MNSRTVATALVGMLAFPGWAQTAPADGTAPAPRMVPVLEPGKPMRFEVVNPPASAPAAVDPCDLEMPQDRRVPSSTACLRCHDGSRALNASTGHRYDIEYATYGKELRVDPEKFNPKVVVASGKVTCLSCHEPLSTTRFRLAAPTDGPVDKRLCAACHIR